MTASATRSAALWRLYGHTYDGLLHFGPYVRLIAEISERVNPRPGMRILELGCGTGNILNQLRSEPGVHLTGVDSSPTMLAVARSKLEAAGPTVVLYEAELLTFLTDCRNAVFDRVVLNNVAYAVGDQTSLWREVIRVLAEDGYAVVSNPDRASAAPIIREHLAMSPAWRLFHPRLVGVFFIDCVISVLGGCGRFDFTPSDTLADQIREAGGVVRQVSRSYGGTNVTFCVHRAGDRSQSVHALSRSYPRMNEGVNAVVP